MTGQLSAKSHALLIALMARVYACDVDGPYDALHEPSRPFLDQLRSEGVIPKASGIYWWETLHGNGQIVINYDEGLCWLSRLYIDPTSGATRHAGTDQYPTRHG
jgi:hypothetical protein